MLLGLQSDVVSIDPDGLKAAVGGFLYGLINLQKGIDTSPIGLEIQRLSAEIEREKSPLLRPIFSHHAVSDDAKAVIVKKLILGHVHKTFVGLWDSEDIVDAVNQFSQNTLISVIETGQPQDHVEHMMRLLSRRYTAVSPETPEQKTQSFEVAKNAVRALAEANTTGAPTTIAETHISGVEIPEIGEIMRIARDIQREILAEADKLSLGSLAHIVSDFRPKQP